MPTHRPPVPVPRGDSGLRVLVVDGHRLVAESVARMLPQLDVVRVATSVTSLSAARTVLSGHGADVVLVDEIVDGEPGLALTETSRAERPPLVVVFSATTSPDRVARALRNGAAGWVTKDARPDELEEALTAVRAGHHWVAQRLRSGVIEALLRDDGTGAAGGIGIRLSQRQGEVLECLMDGMTHAETAERLHLSLNTVRTHVRNMCRLTGVHSTPSLVALARSGHLASSRSSGGHGQL